ncbi:MAG: 3-deoxy-manno-octulosonate cytidylyltransferase [Gammaproteobacteria bacterium]|nr:3-deoxy-manno-octulosonate cytidylyltransferase [Gammaproteobacteria bacterium]
MTASFHIIIPARYAATRLPGKPLLDLGGKTMIARVVDCARRSAAASVTVATDDARIMEAAAAAGARALLTAATHRSGSDRIDEAAAQLQLGADDIIVNLQGDEPRMPAALINQIAARLAIDPQAEMATATAPLDDAAQLADPAVVKVVTCARGYALYFSRAAIPWGGDVAAGDSADGDAADDAAAGDSADGDVDAADGDAAAGPATAPRRHIGIYAYRRDYLRRFAARGACALERRERLEQLRALWHGARIACVEAVQAPPPGVDTAADVERLRAVDWPEKLIEPARKYRL